MRVGIALSLLMLLACASSAPIREVDREANQLSLLQYRLDALNTRWLASRACIDQCRVAHETCSAARQLCGLASRSERADVERSCLNGWDDCETRAGSCRACRGVAAREPPAEVPGTFPGSRAPTASAASSGPPRLLPDRRSAARRVRRGPAVPNAAGGKEVTRTMSRKMLDCRESPSESNCSLVLAGEEDEVLRAAVHHAISVHGHPDTPELREMIRQGLHDEPPGFGLVGAGPQAAARGVEARH